MRIIPDEIMIVLVPIEGVGGLFWKNEDTIEITDDGLDTIAYEWQDDCCVDGLCASHGIRKEYKPFSQYLHELIELARAK